MSSTETHRIRPAGRHVLTIGRDLIQDPYAAIVELVKNAYDADSPDVELEFDAAQDGKSYSIVIADHGHGMTKDTVINSWLVPSTEHKLRLLRSPGGRILQGRKGVGRYATAILGSDLLLETTTSAGEKTSVYIEWKQFESATYLDDVEILVETSKVEGTSGTVLTITGHETFLSNWCQKELDTLVFELKKLISPIRNGNTQEDEFKISLKATNFPNKGSHKFIPAVEPFPIFDLYDYKIAGTVASDGKGTLTFSNHKSRGIADEKITFQFSEHTNCGSVFLDIRVYDREKEALESLVRRSENEPLEKAQVRSLLNTYNGVGVYRNGFRIRPLGDADFDWLKLNEQRVQNPSLRIGSNQVIGYVQIQSEEESNLIEKSARDGLKDNTSFTQLKNITKQVIAKLEERRYAYRRKIGLSRPAQKTERALEKLVEFDDLKRVIQKKLKEVGIDSKITAEIIQVIESEESDKNKLVDEIRQTVAVYQGQATLGKIINVVLHEGRRPLHYFKNQIPNLNHWSKVFRESKSSDSREKILSLTDGVETNADVFVKLFSRLDPLATGKRAEKSLISLKKAVASSIDIFSQTLKDHRIKVTINIPEDFKYSAWTQDIHAIFTNLAENSIYWLSSSKSAVREITVTLVQQNESLLYIDFIDTGPGIESSHIESEVIFEPEFSTKPNGTGLGLAIAGEAAFRNGLELKAFDSKTGAHFRLQPKEASLNE